MGRRSRRYVQGAGLQGLARRMVAILGQHLVDLDMKKAMWTLIDQGVRRIGIKLPHVCASIPAVRQYLEMSPHELAVISDDVSEAKEMCLAIFNGQHIPQKFAGVKLLKDLKMEGDLLRWVACTLCPDFHTAMLEDRSRYNHEGTTFSTCGRVWRTTCLTQSCASRSRRGPATSVCISMG